MLLYLCSCFTLKAVIKCILVDVERTPDISDSLQSSSIQYSKDSTGDNNEEYQQEDSESRKRVRTDKNRNSNREMSSLQTTGGFPPYTSNVGGRRGKS